MRTETLADSRKQIFLVVRYILILTTGALVFVESHGNVSPVMVAFLLFAALASNVVLGSLPSHSFFDPSLQAALLVGDTAMVSIMILFTRAGSEFFFFFFFVLLMAAKIDNLITLGLAGAVVGALSLFLTNPSGMLSPALMRVPFFFAAALFFGYVALPERAGDIRPHATAAKPRRTSSGNETLRVEYSSRLHSPRLR